MKGKKLTDGLCRAAVKMRAHQLLSTVCILGGAKCPLMKEGKARDILKRVKADPTVAIRLESDADEVPHFSALGPEDYARMKGSEVFNRKRDLDVLQRLGLVPGDTRRSRYLYELLFKKIETPNGICAYETPGWEGCPLAKSGAYESVRAKGWKAVVYCRSDEEREEYRRQSAERIRTGERLYIRPHHFMCLSCWYAGGRAARRAGAPSRARLARTVQVARLSPRANDTIYEIHQRIRKEPDVPVTLVEGCCEACYCCDGFDPKTSRCVHAGGLIRDYKKDLDVFQKLGLRPGATMGAREFLKLLFERIPSTKDVCGYGDGVVQSEEWKICGGPEGNPGYAATRRTGLF